MIGLEKPILKAAQNTWCHREYVCLSDSAGEERLLLLACGEWQIRDRLLSNAQLSFCYLHPGALFKASKTCLPCFAAVEILRISAGGATQEFRTPDSESGGK